jgi:hemerythrin-like domain-containing protein
MLVQIGQKPLADFTQPLEMMKDCHRRIEHFLDVLQKVVERFGEGDLPQEGRRALESALDYFAHAAPRHTADEEASLFPRMRRHASVMAHAAMDELQRLEADHRRADACHQRVEQLGRLWLATGRIDARSRTQLRDLLADLVAIYAAHMRLEEERIFVLAAQALKAGELAAVGDEMRQRRQVGRLA